jgi:hypothetical protein
MEKIKTARNKREKAFKDNDTIYRGATIASLFGVFICIYNVPAFREQALNMGIYVVSIHSAWWCLAAFFFHLVYSRL